MMKTLLNLLLAALALTSCYALANGDSLRDSCYQSMRYNVYVQLAGNAYSNSDAAAFEREAFASGSRQGIDSSETKRMIAMASNNPSSAQFSMQYQNDESFAEAYSSGYINDCLEHPDKYISR